MSFHKRISDLLDRTAQGALFKTFVNGGLDADIAVVDALVENDGATIKTAAQYLKAIRDNQTAGTIIAASENHIGQVGGRTHKVYNEFTRPANVTIFAANDIVSNDAVLTLADAVRVAGGSGYLTGIRITTDLAAITPRLRVHFGQLATSFSVLTDNAANANTYAKLSAQGYLGYIDLPAMSSAGAAASYVQDLSQRMPIEASGSTDLYCVIETLDVFTPASEQKFFVHAFFEQN